MPRATGGMRPPRRSTSAGVGTDGTSPLERSALPTEAPTPEPGALAVEEAFPDAGPLVGILVGSESDRPAMEAAMQELDERGISWEFNVLSAHRNPRGVAEYA